MNSPQVLHQRALEYIRNAGGAPKIGRFDDDHEPIGKQLRADLRAAGLAQQFKDHFTDSWHIELTDAGKVAIASTKWTSVERNDHAPTEI